MTVRLRDIRCDVDQPPVSKSVNLYFLLFPKIWYWLSNRVSFDIKIACVTICHYISLIEKRKMNRKRKKRKKKERELLISHLHHHLSEPSRNNGTLPTPTRVAVWTSMKWRRCLRDWISSWRRIWSNKSSSRSMSMRIKRWISRNFR
jgi:hypothetical protein